MLISARYRKAMRGAALIQILVVICSGLILDGGNIEQLCAMALLPFWTVTVIFIWRRPQQPTRTDLMFIRVGYLLVVVVTGFLAPLIWRLRGVL